MYKITIDNSLTYKNKEDFKTITLYLDNDLNLNLVVDIIKRLNEQEELIKEYI